MKKLILFILWIVLVYVSCQRHKYPFAKQISQSSQVKEGQKLYMQYCQRCHPDGEAGLGPSIYYLPGFAKKFQTRHGVGVMPAFDEKVISDEELDKIILYLKELA
jgi:mono/diheme cytochrome c family protein